MKLPCGMVLCSSCECARRVDGRPQFEFDPVDALEWLDEFCGQTEKEEKS